MPKSSFPLLILLTLPCTIAFAQSQAVDFDTSAQGQAVMEDDIHNESSSPNRPGKTSEWRIAVGGGVMMAPTYSGSDSYRARVVPIAQVNYKQFFIGASGIGMHLYRDRNWDFRASLSPSRGRDEADDADLRGLGNIDRTIRAGVLASYRAGRFDTRVQLNSDIGGKKQGTLARLDVSYLMLVNKRWILSVGPGITWASGEYTQSFFGVTTDQSTRSGLPIFTAAGGLNSVRISATALYRFNRHWLGSASASINELQGDAASSPITTSRTQGLLFAGATYRF